MADENDERYFDKLESLEQFVQDIRNAQGDAKVSRILARGDKVRGGRIAGREGMFPGLSTLQGIIQPGEMTAPEIVRFEMVDSQQASIENPNNILERLDRLEAFMREILRREVVTDDLSDLSPTGGETRTGRNIFGEGVPENGDFSGIGIAWPPFSINGQDWGIVGMQGGRLQFALRSSDGKAYFSGGNQVLDYTGISYLGVGILGRINTIDAEFTFGGLFLDNGSGVGMPYMGQHAIRWTGSNLIVNGTFETGDFTGWVETGSPEITTDAPTGSYAAKVDDTNYISQSFVSIPGTYYHIRLLVKEDTGFAHIRVTGADIASADLYASSFWTNAQILIKATGGAVTIELLSNPLYGGDSYFDAIDVRRVTKWSTSSASWLSPNDMIIKGGGGLQLATGGAVSEFSTDGTLAANSDSKVSTQKAVKTYVNQTVNSHDHIGGDGAAITEGALSLSDVTTANADTTKHGFAPKGDGVTTHFLRGDHTWATPPGGAGASATTIEVDLGSTPVRTGRFTITDAGIDAASKVMCWQAPGPYTGKGSLADEAEMDPLRIVAVYPAVGSAEVVWESAAGIGLAWPAPGNSRLSVLAPPQDDPQARTTARRAGAVKGNFKFSYIAFS